MKSRGWAFKSKRRMLLWAVVVGAFGLMLGLRSCPIGFRLGHTFVDVRGGFLTTRDAFYDHSSGFISDSWDGPTGEFSHGRIFGLKVRRWLLRVDIVEDPPAAARKSLRRFGEYQQILRPRRHCAPHKRLRGRGGVGPRETGRNPR